MVAAERQTGPRAVARKASPAGVKRSDCGIECQELSLCAVSTGNLAGGPWAGPLSHLGVLSAKRRDTPLLPQCWHPSCPRQPGTVASVGVGLQPLCQAVVFKESLTFGGLVFRALPNPPRAEVVGRVCSVSYLPSLLPDCPLPAHLCLEDAMEPSLTPASPSRPLPWDLPGATMTSYTVDFFAVCRALSHPTKPLNKPLRGPLLFARWKPEAQRYSPHPSTWVRAGPQRAGVQAVTTERGPWAPLWASFPFQRSGRPASTPGIELQPLAQ